MAKYIDKTKADKARRKKMTYICTVDKAKAKEMVNKPFLYVYGRYLDGVTEIGTYSKNERIIAHLKETYNEVA